MFIYLLCTLFNIVYQYVWVYICEYLLSRGRESIPLDLELQVAMTISGGFWESNLGPVKEQYTLVTTSS